MRYKGPEKGAYASLERRECIRWICLHLIYTAQSNSRWHSFYMNAIFKNIEIVYDTKYHHSCNVFQTCARLMNISFSASGAVFVYYTLYCRYCCMKHVLLLHQLKGAIFLIISS